MTSFEKARVERWMVRMVALMGEMVQKHRETKEKKMHRIDPQAGMHGPGSVPVPV